MATPNPPLGDLARALLMASDDASNGIRIFDIPPQETETMEDWLEAYLQRMEQRAHHILNELSRNQKSKIPAINSKHAQSVLGLCETVRECAIANHLSAAVVTAICAMNALWMSEDGRALRQNARKGGTGRLSTNPVLRAKQQAKQEAKHLWIERYQGMHPELRTNEQFAIEATRRWSNELPSIAVVCGWCTQWTKEVAQFHRLVPQ